MTRFKKFKIKGSSFFVITLISFSYYFHFHFAVSLISLLHSRNRVRILGLQHSLHAMTLVY